MEGKVQTVLGLVDPKSLGKTLTHEHLSLIFDVAYTAPKPEYASKINLPVNLTNLGWIRQNPYSNKTNIGLRDPESWAAVEQELDEFKALGGGCIVENTTHGISRNTEFLHRISQKSGVHIVGGTGYYVDGAQSESTRKMTVEKMTKVMTTELLEGCIDFPNVKCGVVGEVGCSWPLTDFEKKSIQATGEVQATTGCPVIFHPGRHSECPAEIIRIYQESGGNVSRAVMSHLDRTIHTLEELSQFATLGSFCEYDLFGIEVSHYQLDEKIDMPSDAQRIQRIKHLINEGFEDKILIAHDIHTKHRLGAFGGHGYSHIFNNVVPKMKLRGITEMQIEKILINNPANWLTFQ